MLGKTSAESSAFSSFDEDMMRRALKLAQRGAGWTNPNPLVGAVIVKDKHIIGEGFHERYGQAHAERNALRACEHAGEDPAGARIYVNLEPCCHTGKQAPCTEAIIQAGIKEVIIGSPDPNPLVAGKGISTLQAAGVCVQSNCLRKECDEINRIFFHFIQKSRPYVIAKWAMTLDGKTCTATGDSRWISGDKSRADVHELRHRVAAIMVGSRTVLIDDPLLNVRRNSASKQPLRVVVDSKLCIPLESKLVQTAREQGLLVATAQSPKSPKALQLRDRGVEIIDLPNEKGKVDLRALISELGKRNMDSLLVEGGMGLQAALFNLNLVNQADVYLAPKIVAQMQHMNDALCLSKPYISAFDDDIKLSFYGPDTQACTPQDLAESRESSVRETEERAQERYV